MVVKSILNTIIGIIKDEYKYRLCVYKVNKLKKKGQYIQAYALLAKQRKYMESQINK